MVGDQGIEPCASRSQTEHSTDELVPDKLGAASGNRTRILSLARKNSTTEP